MLKVDRITVYRMLDDGRIKGVKVGQQWRFLRNEVDRLLGTKGPIQPAVKTANFPTHCVQTIQDLFSDVSQVSALITDAEGEPLTQVSRPCRFCQIIQQDAEGQNACQNDWKEFTRKTKTGKRFFTCHAGLQYVSAPIVDNGEVTACFLVGEFQWQTPHPTQAAERAKTLSAMLNIPAEALLQADQSVQTIDPEKQTRVEAWPAAAAVAIQAILQERSGFIFRLNQIASLTQI